MRIEDRDRGSASRAARVPSDMVGAGFARRLSIRSVVAAGVVLLAAACDDSSPTEPRSSQALARVVINDPAGAFAQHHAALRSLIEETTATAGSELSVSMITVEVFADPLRSIRDYGIGGFTLGPSRIELYVDPGYPGLGLVLPERVPPLVAHEIHHAVRWRGLGPPRTLLETLVFEGLADHFAIELLGTPLQPWSQAFPESETDFYLNLARPDFDSATFDYQGWFFGADPRLPRWAGYTLGWRIVAEYQARTRRSAAQLVNTPAEAFRPPPRAGAATENGGTWPGW